ncbi:acyl carrier protein [Lipingzhangella halophila]|uniref:acyl carrier protein n=1 Tax=Lipingzhangella halophila TaxID=1783352 RepID=UPI0016160175
MHTALVQLVARILGCHPENLDAHTPLGELGISSIATLELRAQLRAQLHGAHLPTDLPSPHTTLAALTHALTRPQAADTGDTGFHPRLRSSSRQRRTNDPHARIRDRDRGHPHRQALRPRGPPSSEQLLALGLRLPRGRRPGWVPSPATPSPDRAPPSPRISSCPFGRARRLHHSTTNTTGRDNRETFPPALAQTDR